MTDDYADMEEYILLSAAAPSLEFLRPHFPGWRGYFRSQGVERVSIRDTHASNLMILVIKQAMEERNKPLEHEQRNLIALTNPRSTMRAYKP